jgi:hypothetical protein
MKKFFALSLLTLALVTVSHQQAHAWSNIKFGAGVNVQWQTGDNTLLWGLFRNGQVPHPYGTGVPPHLMGGPPPAYAPMALPHGAGPVSAPLDGGAAGFQGQTQANPAGYQQPQNASGYQPVSYQPANYYYPTYNPYYAQHPVNSPPQVPSYWYGR